MLNKKLWCLKLTLIVKAVKAKQNSSKIAKIRLFCCDVQYYIIKFDFLIFKFEHSSLNYFIHAEVGILNLLLIFGKKVSHNVFMKKLTWRDILQQFTKFEQQDFIQTCIKLRIVLIAVQIFKKIKEKSLFASEWDFWWQKILTNFDQTPNFDFILTYKTNLNWLLSTRNQC